MALACRRDAAASLERGDRLLATGQPRQALAEFQGALERQPSAHAERGLGLAYEALGAYSLAERHLSAALEARPEDTDARVALARVLTRFGKYDRARVEASRAIEQNPESEPAVLLFGVYAETRPQIQLAIEALEAYEAAQKRVGRILSHAAALVLADLYARTNQPEAALRRRAGVRLARLGGADLTRELARAAEERGSHELARDLLTPLLERHPEDADGWLVLARAALELGQLAQARDALGHLRARAADPEVRLLAARLGLASGLETAPIAELRALLAELPSDRVHARADVRRVLATALDAQRRGDEAERELATVLRELPGDVEASLALAELRLGRGDASGALVALGELTEHHGQLARAHAAIGRAELRLGRLEDAEASFRRLWELAPHEPEARHLLSLALWRRGQSAQARRLLEGNLKRFPTHVESLTAAAKLHEQGAGSKDATTFVIEHAQRHPESPEIAHAEGEWLLSHRDAERALVAWRRALALDPSHFPTVSALARFHARSGRPALAESVLEAALAHAPKDLRTLLLAARVASESRRYEDARRYTQRALELSPDQPAALAEWASVEAEGFGNYDRAQSLLARAQAAAPSNTEVLDAVGWVAHLAGNSALALPNLRRAAEQDADNPRIRYHLGAALLGAGDAAAAHQELARVLALDPSFPTASEIRTVLARR